MEILICTKPADSSEHYNYNIVKKKSVSVWFLSLEVISKDRIQVQSMVFPWNTSRGKKNW